MGTHCSALGFVTKRVGIDIFILEVLGSNLDRTLATLHDAFLWVSPVPPGIFWDNTSFSPLVLPSRSVLIHHLSYQWTPSSLDNGSGVK